MSFYSVEVRGGVSRAVVLDAVEPDWNSSSDPRHVVKWSKTAGLMAGSQRSKAVKLASHNCIQYTGGGCFVCLPIDTHSEVAYGGRVYRKVACDRDYNRDPTPYVLHRLIGCDEWLCTCQWSSKMHLPCAHILALMIEFKRKKFGGIKMDSCKKCGSDKVYVDGECASCSGRWKSVYQG